jgi:hypothetical protein
MRLLGSKGGRARRKGAAEQLPAGERESLRQYLRDGLDREMIRAAIERSLAGDNESARVACVKFLSDLELYRRDGDECPRCSGRDLDEEDAHAGAKLMKLIEGQRRAMVAAFAENGPSGRPLEADGFVPRAQVEVLAEELAQARLQVLKQSTASSTRKSTMWAPGRGVVMGPVPGFRRTDCEYSGSWCCSLGAGPSPGPACGNVTRVPE